MYLSSQASNKDQKNISKRSFITTLYKDATDRLNYDVRIKLQHFTAYKLYSETFTTGLSGGLKGRKIYV